MQRASIILASIRQWSAVAYVELAFGNVENKSLTVYLCVNFFSTEKLKKLKRVWQHSQYRDKGDDLKWEGEMKRRLHATAKGKPIHFWGLLSLSSTTDWNNGRLMTTPSGQAGDSMDNGDSRDEVHPQEKSTPLVSGVRATCWRTEIHTTQASDGSSTWRLRDECEWLKVCQK